MAQRGPWPHIILAALAILVMNADFGTAAKGTAAYQAPPVHLRAVLSASSASAPLADPCSGDERQLVKRLRTAAQDHVMSENWQEAAASYRYAHISRASPGRAHRAQRSLTATWPGRELTSMDAAVADDFNNMALCHQQVYPLPHTARRTAAAESLTGTDGGSHRSPWCSWRSTTRRKLRTGRASRASTTPSGALSFAARAAPSPRA